MKSNGTGVWFASTPRFKVMWRGHDSFYLAIGRLRLRIMKRGT